MQSRHSIAIDQLRPFFQPIVSVANGTIFGYEVLARLQGDAGQYNTIGWFFGDESVSDEDRIAVDRAVRERALQYVKEHPESGRLFLNIHPNWIFNYRESTETFPTLRLLDELGIDGENIVIEITEQKFLEANFEFLNRLIDRYRERGIKIAIDDFSFPNFDRLLSINCCIV